MDRSIVIVTRNMLAGGAERVIAQLANYFVKQGIDVKIVTLDDEKMFYDINSQIEMIAIGKKSTNRLLDKWKRYSEVRRIVDCLKPDVVLSMPEDIGIYVILALLGCRIPVYVSERNNPWVMPNVKVTRLLRRLMYPFAKGLIFQTDTAKSFFPKNIQKKSVVIGNPIDSDRIPQKYSGKRRKVVVGAGRLEAQKNFSLLIAAFAEFSKIYQDYELVIYGEGSMRRQLEEEIAMYKLEKKVFLPGRKSNLLELVNDCSMFVLSSDYEGMPNVLLEAMCMGMPVISTDCPSGGPRELIKNMENGILVPVNGKDEIIKAMSYLTDEDISRRFSENALMIRNRLTDSQIFEKWFTYLFKSSRSGK